MYPAKAALPDADSGKRRSAVMLVASVVVSCFAAGWAPIADGDIFWHLAAGREMWQRGALLTHDPFSIGAAGRPWVDVHWLFQLGAYAVHSQFGSSGLVIAKCALLTGSALVLLFGLPRSARAVYVALLATTLLLVRHLLLVRPTIVSLLCLSVFWVVLERHRKQRDARILWLLLPVQMIWSNVQGLFALGPALIAAYAIAAAHSAWSREPTGLVNTRGHEQQRPLSIAERTDARALFAALSCSVIAALVSPFGAHTLQLPVRLLARLLPSDHSPYQSVAENVPPLAISDVNVADFWHLPWFLLALASVLALRRRHLPLSHLLTLSGFVGLALLGNRNVLLLYFIAAPLCALQLSPLLRSVRQLRFAPALVQVPVLAVLLTAALQEPAIAAPTPFHFPTQSAQAIAAHGGKGEVFCADSHGGYLIWQLYPAFRPFADTRWILRSPEELREYLGLADHPERFAAFAAQHDFSYVVLPVSYPDRYLGLIAELYASPRWKLVYTDGAEVLFAKSELVQGGAWDLSRSEVSDRILAELSTRYARAELLSAARLQLATLQLAVGASAQAQRSLADLPGPEALALRARAHLYAGELASAADLAERMLRERPDDLRSLDLMAQVLVRRGDTARALPLLQRAVKIDPLDAEATSLLTNLEVQHGR